MNEYFTIELPEGQISKLSNTIDDLESFKTIARCMNQNELLKVYDFYDKYCTSKGLIKIVKNALTETRYLMFNKFIADGISTDGNIVRLNVNFTVRFTDLIIGDVINVKANTACTSDDSDRYIIRSVEQYNGYTLFKCTHLRDEKINIIVSYNGSMPRILTIGANVYDISAGYIIGDCERKIE